MITVIIVIIAEERVTVSRDQLTRFQEICDQVGVGAESTSTIPRPEDVPVMEDLTSDASCLAGIHIDDHSGIYSTDGKLLYFSM